MSLSLFLSMEDADGAPVEASTPGDPIEYDAPFESDPSPEATDALSNQQAILGQMARANDAVVAIEAYQALLNANPQGVQAVTAQAILLGLEQYRDVLGGVLDRFPSLEAFGHSSSLKQATVVSQEGLADMAKTAGSALVALFKALKEWIMSFYRQFTEDCAKLKSKLLVLKADAQRLGDSEPQQTEFDVSGMNRLMVDGKVVAKRPEILAGLVVYASTIYPKQIEDYFKAIAVGTRRLGPGHFTEGDVEGVFNAAPSPLSKFDAGLSNTTFPGDMKLSFANAKQDGLARFFEMNLEMFHAPSKNTSAVKYAVDRPNELINRVLKLIKIVDNLEHAQNNSRGTQVVADDFVKAMALIEKTASSKGYDDQETQVANALLSAAKKAPKMMGPGLAPVLSYCFKTLTAYTAVLNHEIRAYGAPAEQA